MANTYFQFKQFTVNQEHCAMKVCTDACIQGAFTAQYLVHHGVAVKRILDIGTGTGLLSLMLAQVHPAAITAVELDPGAALQARENFNASPWQERLDVQEVDVRQLPVSEKFDFIISNPPFYESALKSGHQQKDKAMHATSLGYSELLEAIGMHLKPGASFSILLPYVEFQAFRALAASKGYHLHQLLQVRQSMKHGYFRAVGIFSAAARETSITDMDIRDMENQYTPAFIALLKAYYLKL
ncbi:tRNA1Val (adenine37-N6)-methyltransferase [Chitinophaga jiangningensis]|uniref:tRNA1(Val) (adenine(37)-N6)-methyltransferase n=1 Tax=Chitinophaga jiangningensis TaxID=1419482 RepID=A0A1M7KEK8_9BACT|nr:methyltransferase [Chitinophaga jiangningensis]SHM63262.1 tRNA1Val (adenine37-N6)-methyltransferase [Chitinophaga jiangningensis]